MSGDSARAASGGSAAVMAPPACAVEPRTLRSAVATDPAVFVERASTSIPVERRATRPSRTPGAFPGRVAVAVALLVLGVLGAAWVGVGRGAGAPAGAAGAASAAVVDAGGAPAQAPGDAGSAAGAASAVASEVGAPRAKAPVTPTRHRATQPRPKLPFP
jgi:hypothetical protein